ncbi:hypothetical protein E2C01_034581 [Portunus trituberculatus]|uniref:Uncharacterized protein n=1 Tax=Portunus trituberculatus TaxID=210409 RepID=A0A5B7F375_PORTR|nr:hypothetical protein [Portunus trituberculatus]
MLSNISECVGVMEIIKCVRGRLTDWCSSVI